VNTNGGNPTRKDGAQVPSTVAQIVITWDQVSGAINVQGPIQNATLCYGMLESAKDVIRKYVEQNQSPIIKPSGLQVVGN
jgi:hypothetical protein